MRTLEPHCNLTPAGVTLPPATSGGNLFARLEAGAASCPDAVVATDADGCQFTCQQLLDASLVLAGYMQQRLEVRSGERVLLMMPACIPQAIAWYATLRCDAVVAALAAHATAEDVARCAWNTSARVAIVMDDGLARVAALLGDGRLRGGIVAGPDPFARPKAGGPPAHSHVHALGDALAAGIAPAPMRATASDLAVLAYGVGTGGHPEVVQWRHGSGVRFPGGCAG